MNQTYLLSASSNREADAWVSVMSEAIQPAGVTRSLMDGFMDMRTELQSHKKRKVETVLGLLDVVQRASKKELEKRKELFVEADSCSLCRKDFQTVFGKTRGRHHCRLCSMSVCEECSGYRSRSHPYEPLYKDVPTETARRRTRTGRWKDEVRVCLTCEDALEMKAQALARDKAVEEANARPEVGVSSLSLFLSIARATLEE